jgi:hypothetical protein
MMLREAAPRVARVAIVFNPDTAPESYLTYVRNADPLAQWFESICIEYNAQVFIGKENYFLSAEGFLMPAKKWQKPPDLRYFGESQKR